MHAVQLMDAAVELSRLILECEIPENKVLIHVLTAARAFGTAMLTKKIKIMEAPRYRFMGKETSTKQIIPSSF